MILILAFQVITGFLDLHLGQYLFRLLYKILRLIKKQHRLLKSSHTRNIFAQG